MRTRSCVSLILLTVIALQFVAAQTGVLSNDDIIEMLDKQVAEPTILKVILLGQGSFDASDSSLQVLREHGASEAVISAVQVRASVAAPSAGEPQTTEEESAGAQPSTAVAGARKRTVCAASLEACAPNGCAAPNSDRAAFNEAKRRIGSGKTTLLTFDDFTELQNQAENLVGSGGDISANDRAKIHAVQVNGRAIGEGSMVRLVGFVVGKPHPNSGESVNCSLAGEPNNDIHIPIAKDPDLAEYNGVVVEMIPQGRAGKTNWTSIGLNRVAKLRRPVMVEGQLFYDNEHVVNSDEEHDRGGQPKRFSLWEIHPVKSFKVCKTKSNCNPGVAANWVPLEKMVLPRQ